MQLNARNTFILILCKLIILSFVFSLPVLENRNINFKISSSESKIESLSFYYHSNTSPEQKIVKKAFPFSGILHHSPFTLKTTSLYRLKFETHLPFAFFLFFKESLARAPPTLA